MKNTYSQILLYAKGWFQKKDTIEDLKVLVGDYMMTPPEQVTINDIVSVLISMCKELCDYDKFENLIFNCLINIDYYKSKEKVRKLYFITEVLKDFFKITDKDVINGIGEPNYNLLPKNQNVVNFEKLHEKYD